MIGAGKISEQHLRFVANTPRAVLAGVCDLSPTPARCGVDRFARPGVTRAFTGHRRMRDEIAPDVAHVLTPAPERAAATRHVVHVSSRAINDDMKPPAWSTLDERSPVERDAFERDAFERDACARAKLVQERLVRGAAIRGGWACCRVVKWVRGLYTTVGVATSEHKARRVGSRGRG